MKFGRLTTAPEVNYSPASQEPRQHVAYNQAILPGMVRIAGYPVIHWGTRHCGWVRSASHASIAVPLGCQLGDELPDPASHVKVLHLIGQEVEGLGMPDGATRRGPGAADYALNGAGHGLHCQSPRPGNRTLRLEGRHTLGGYRSALGMRDGHGEIVNTAGPVDMNASPWAGLDGPTLASCAAALQLMPENIPFLTRLQRAAVIGAALPTAPGARPLSPSGLWSLLKHPLISGEDVRRE